jgi:hypothetical protein
MQHKKMRNDGQRSPSIILPQKLWCQISSPPWYSHEYYVSNVGNTSETKLRNSGPQGQIVSIPGSSSIAKLGYNVTAYGTLYETTSSPHLQLIMKETSILAIPNNKILDSPVNLHTCALQVQH